MKRLIDTVSEKFMSLYGDKPLHAADAVKVLVAAMSEVTGGYVRVKYKGIHDRHNDIAYQTGIWRKGEVKALDADSARKLLKHPDVFVKARETKVETLEVVDIPERKEDVQRMEEKERLILMFQQANDSDYLRELAMESLSGWEPDKRLKDPLKLQGAIIDYINQVM